MENKQVVCDGCGFYKDEFFINKHKNGKNYCNGCVLEGIKVSDSDRPITKAEFDEVIKVLLNTPPRKKDKKGSNKERIYPSAKQKK